MKAPDRRFRDSSVWRKRIAPSIRARDVWCRMCALLGKRVVGSEVDHIHRCGNDRFLQRSPDNLQLLCRPCHQLKTQWEMGDTSKPMLVGYDVSGWPITWMRPPKPVDRGPTMA
jgi:5-methylcytosine-specific restriction endonuclease McrA